MLVQAGAASFSLRARRCFVGLSHIRSGVFSYFSPSAEADGNCAQESKIIFPGLLFFLK